MEIIITQKQSHMPVTVVQLSGKMDGSNYMELIETARKLYETGTRNLLIDLSRLTYMSSAGLTAIHKTALVFNGVLVPDEESGWTAYHNLDLDRQAGLQPHVKLLSPQPNVANVFEITGLKAMFEIHYDMQKAVESFE